MKSQDHEKRWKKGWEGGRGRKEKMGCHFGEGAVSGCDRVSLNGNFSIGGDELGLLHGGFRIAQIAREEYTCPYGSIFMLGVYFYKSRRVLARNPTLSAALNSFKISIQIVALGRTSYMNDIQGVFCQVLREIVRTENVIWNALPPFIWSLVINFPLPSPLPRN